jgi:hypothetical protein
MRSEDEATRRRLKSHRNPFGHPGRFDRDRHALTVAPGPQVFPVLLSLCAAVMVMCDRYLQIRSWPAAWPWFWNGQLTLDDWWVKLALSLEHLSLALLLGLGIGLLYGDVALTSRQSEP